MTAILTYRIFRPGRSFAAGFGAGLLGGWQKNVFTPEATDRGTGMPPKISSQDYFCFLVHICLYPEPFLVFCRGIGRALRNQDHFFFCFCFLFFGARDRGMTQVGVACEQMDKMAKTAHPTSWEGLMAFFPTAPSDDRHGRSTQA